jgi:hypothetical protein
MLTLQVFGKDCPLPTLVRLFLCCQVKRPSGLPHSLVVVVARWRYGVLEAADDYFIKERGTAPLDLPARLHPPPFPNNTNFFSEPPDPHGLLHTAYHNSRNLAKWLPKREQHREYLFWRNFTPTTRLRPRPHHFLCEHCRACLAQRAGDETGVHLHPM